MTPGVLKKLLDKFGHKCLIICDGFDEYDGKNEDISKIIQGQKLRQCSFILTSRPHSVANLERYFQTIVRIDGFTKDHTLRFVSKCLWNSRKVSDVVEFNDQNFLHTGLHFARPMILLFICILDNENEIDLKRRDVQLAEILWRLVHCFYRKYCVRKKRKYRKHEFLDVLFRIGKFAEWSLRTEQNSFQRSEVIKCIGEDVFEYGFLVGHVNYKLMGQETSDIFVTFAHRTFQDFLGLSVQNLGSREKCQFQWLVHTDIDLLHCCIHIMRTTCEEMRQEFDLQLVQSRFFEQFLSQFNTRTLDLINLCRVHRASDICVASNRKDQLVLELMREVLAKCSNVRELVLSENDPIDWILSSLKPVVPQISAIHVVDEVHTFGKHIGNPIFSNGKYFMLLAETCTPAKLETFLQQFSQIRGSTCVILEKGEIADCLEISSLIRKGINRLYFVGVGNALETRCDLTMTGNIMKCSELAHLSLIGFNLHPTVPMVLSKAVQNGNLWNLTHLSFAGCRLGLYSSLHSLFQSTWPSLLSLNLNQCHLDENDFRILSLCLNDAGNKKLPKLKSLVLFVGEVLDDVLARINFHHDDGTGMKFERAIDLAMLSIFHGPWSTISTLSLHSVNKEEYKDIVASLNQGSMPSLKTLCISMWQHLHTKVQ